jgi:hypothetical protein
MAGGGFDNNDGSDIFWPGYVDATTNLILNLLFLLTILIVAVFMFALELGRAVGPQDANADATAVVETVSAETDPVKEIIALKSEIQRLKMLLAENNVQRAQGGGEVKSIEGTSAVSKPLNGLDTALASDFELTVRFKDEAVSFTQTERESLLEALKPAIVSGSAIIYVEVPGGFSEAKRMGFYRALAVRNILIEMKVPTDNIDVSVVEGATDANASVVKVRSR